MPSSPRAIIARLRRRIRSGAGWSPTLPVRMAGAFVLVALLSVGLVASLSLIFAEKDLSELAAQRRDDLASSLVADAAATYRADGRWTAAELEPVERLASVAGARVAVLDADGRVVVATLPSQLSAVQSEQVPIVVETRRVGTLVIAFQDSGIDAAASRLHRSLALAVAGAVVLAGLLACSVAVLAARGLTGPLVRLIDTARAVAHGDRSARVGLVRAAPEIRALAATVDAMTDTLVRQEQLQRDLVADVAHELRTPIAVLQASCEAMLDAVNVPSHAEVASLHEEVLRLARLVNDLQTLAAAEAASLHLIVDYVDLAQIAAEAADAVATRLTAAGLHLHRDLAPAIVHADRDRLRQVVLNLLTNAAKFTPVGGQVTISVRPGAQLTTLSVTDTGIGIGPDELPHIFHRFWRARRAGGTAGTGIGLAIVAELVRVHGGTVHASSHPGAGTTLTVSLPTTSAAGRAGVST